MVVGDNQHFRGYTLFLCKEHKTELFQLDKLQKMNYELLGNGDTHLHWHLFPRKNGDIENYGNNGKGPVWWYPMEKMYSDDNRPSEEELEQMKSKLLIELDKLL